MPLKVDTSATLSKSITLRGNNDDDDAPAITDNNNNSATMTTSDIEEAAPTKELEVSDGTAPDSAEAEEGALPAPQDPSAERKFSRKLSISEIAQERSSGRCPAPWFLKWIEVPFRVKNNQTNQYLEEATGHAMDVSARGPINQTGSFVGSAMIRLAITEAGGPNEYIHGMKASSVLTIATLIVGITAGVTMPMVGAIVDHTDHRKGMGAVSALIVTIAVGVQVILSQDTWFICFILEIIGGYFLIMHQVCTMAYLPDLTHDVIEMGHYTARLMMNQYFVQGIFTSIVIGCSFGIPLGNNDTAILGAGMACAIGAVFFGYAWIFLFRKRPKLREIPPGSNLYSTGFKQLYKTAKEVFREYKALKWFMISLLFSPEAGAGVVLAIAVTFLTVFVNMETKEIAAVSLAMLFMNIPGALLSKYMCKKINPLNSFRCAELLFATTNALIAGTITGSTDRDKTLVYFYAALIGISFGWMFPSQRTLAVALIPKGQETEIMGLISFFGQILGWLPLVFFLLMNQAGVDMRWGLSIISFFLVTSFFFTLMVGPFDDAVAKVSHTSDIFVNEYAKKSGVNADVPMDGGSFVAAVEAADEGEKEIENGESA